MSAKLHDTNEQDEYTYLESNAAENILLLDLAQNFKGVDPDIDRRIDAAAAEIVGKSFVKSIPPHPPGAPRKPLYFEGSPGTGKTTLSRSAFERFCKIAGLNMVEHFDESFIPGPNDAVFAVVNLSGETNKSEMGGLMTRLSYGSVTQEDGDVSGEAIAALKEIATRIEAGADLANLKVSRAGGNNDATITIEGAAAIADRVWASAIDGAQRHFPNTKFRETALPTATNEVGYKVKGEGTGKISISLAAPPESAEDATKRNAVQYVAAKLPNVRFAQIARARFAMVNFDDVANASEPVRNVLLEVAQFGRVSGLMNTGRAYIALTGNIGAADNTNTMSRASDAEVTRVEKYRILDTPQAWAERMMAKYATTGDCQFASFIQISGSQPGIFSSSKEAPAKRGAPKPNSRSLENALAAVSGYFQMAKDADTSVLYFQEEIRTRVAATAGKRVADAYLAHVVAMETQAVPLAKEVLETGKIPEAFHRHVVDFNSPAEQDFGFRFSTALAEAFSSAYGDDKKAKGRAQAFENVCVGLGQVQPTMSAFALSKIALSLGEKKEEAESTGKKINVILDDDLIKDLAKGFAGSVKKGAWDDPESAEIDFKTSISGFRSINDALPASRK